MIKTNFQKIFKKEKNILIGMLHLPPLLSLKGFLGVPKMIQKALRELSILERAGFDAVLIENDNDKPHTEFANEAQIACLTAVAYEVSKKAKIPIGVQMMLNDWKSSIAIARVVGARFTRLDVFVDHVTCEWCEINPNPKGIMEYKKAIYPELLVLTDIQVKYKKMVHPRSLKKSGGLAIKNGSDAIIITGKATGIETPLQKIIEIRNAFPLFPILVGAGVNAKNILEQFSYANGGIIGSSIKTNGVIDYIKAKKLQMLVTSK